MSKEREQKKEYPKRVGIEVEDQAGSDPRWLEIRQPSLKIRGEPLVEEDRFRVKTNEDIRED